MTVWKKKHLRDMQICRYADMQIKNPHLHICKFAYLHIFCLFLVAGCSQLGNPESKSQDTTLSTTMSLPAFADSASVDSVIAETTETGINMRDVLPADVVAYAKTLIGVPYKYASTDPAQGFDCSGFITYVFNHFKMTVPRSSVEFTNEGREVIVQEALPGDLILFTGTDSTIRVVGHMGIVTETSNDTLSFIHSTSGKQYGVTITPLNKYYKSRFVKVIRVF
jgi:cell wall-associated NlpC family hydrolase